ncbi:MAG: glycosyltransferase [Phycisphaerales bacterium]|nr:glycosyltransferase [Phycisphaerales bacterium]
MTPAFAGPIVPVFTSTVDAPAPCAELAAERKWRRRNAYYYAQLHRLFKLHVPAGARVLEIGCGAGDLLADLQPSYGVGIEPSRALSHDAQRRHPRLNIINDRYDRFATGESFDYVVISNAVGHMRDVQRVFERLRGCCHSRTRLVVAYFNALWEPALAAASCIGQRRKTSSGNWLSTDDIVNLLSLTDFQVVRKSAELLLPKNVPLLSAALNRVVAKFWPFNKLALVTFFVARPMGLHDRSMRPKCSVIVPTHDERGNIADVVRHTPELGSHTEIIFVDGASTDGTVQEIENQIHTNPNRDIRLVHQGRRGGKGDAVRRGFAAATGDILMILDADLTVVPDELHKFYDALVTGRGELINGTRLVYPLEDQAMRPLNKLANKMFSLLFSWLLNQRFRDTLCGTKALWRCQYEVIAANRRYFGEMDPFGDFDLIFGAARADQKILEIPVRYGPRRYGNTSIHRFRDGWRLWRMSWVAFRKLKMR